MGWPKRKKRELLKPLGFVSVEGKGSQSFLISSTEDTSLASQTRIRGRLENAHLIEASVNPTTAAKVSIGSISGVKYPDDFNDWKSVV